MSCWEIGHTVFYFVPEDCPPSLESDRKQPGQRSNTSGGKTDKGGGLVEKEGPRQGYHGNAICKKTGSQGFR